MAVPSSGRAGETGEAEAINGRMTPSERYRCPDASRFRDVHCRDDVVVANAGMPGDLDDLLGRKR